MLSGGLPIDGKDYYVYEFTDEKGKEIEEYLKRDSNWETEKISGDKINFFSQNEEVHLIENGYYYFELLGRGGFPDENITAEESNGFEQAIYDVDKNILYYIKY